MPLIAALIQHRTGESISMERIVLKIEVQMNALIWDPVAKQPTTKSVSHLPVRTQLSAPPSWTDKTILDLTARAQGTTLALAAVIYA